MRGRCGCSRDGGRRCPARRSRRHRLRPLRDAALRPRADRVRVLRGAVSHGRRAQRRCAMTALPRDAAQLGGEGARDCGSRAAGLRRGGAELVAERLSEQRAHDAATVVRLPAGGRELCNARVQGRVETRADPHHESHIIATARAAGSLRRCHAPSVAQGATKGKPSRILCARKSNSVLGSQAMDDSTKRGAQ